MFILALVDGGASIALVAGLAAASAATSAYAASAQNKSAKRQVRSAGEAANIRAKQNADAAALERKKTVDNLRQVRGRIAVSAAEAGTGASGSVDQLQFQATSDAATNLQIITANENNSYAAIKSGLDADVARAQTTNPLLAAFQGGLSGASSGLQIAQGINNINGPKKPPANIA